AVQLGDAVRSGGEPQCEGRQPEAADTLGPSERQQLLLAEPGARCEISDVADDELVSEDLVARRDRRVRGEDRGAPHDLQRALRLFALLVELARALDREERRVALVDMKDGRLQAERRE